jgi:hypothetical protein
MFSLYSNRLILTSYFDSMLAGSQNNGPRSCTKPEISRKAIFGLTPLTRDISKSYGTQDEVEDSAISSLLDYCVCKSSYIIIRLDLDLTKFQVRSIKQHAFTTRM